MLLIWIIPFTSYPNRTCSTNYQKLKLTKPPHIYIKLKHRLVSLLGLEMIAVCQKVEDRIIKYSVPFNKEHCGGCVWHNLSININFFFFFFFGLWRWTNGMSIKPQEEAKSQERTCAIPVINHNLSLCQQQSAVDNCGSLDPLKSPAPWSLTAKWHGNFLVMLL